MDSHPKIEVLIARGNARHPSLLQVLYGIEEEQVPVSITETDGESVEKMAYEAAERSKLEVGIGMDAAGNFALHHKKLEIHSPYIRLPKRSSDERARIFGNNSARLVKRMPLRHE